MSEHEKSVEEIKEEEVKAQVEVDYAVDKSDDGDSDFIKAIKTDYKVLALKIVDTLPDSRERFLALDDLNRSKLWAVSAGLTTGETLGPPEIEPPAKAVTSSHSKK